MSVALALAGRCGLQENRRCCSEDMLGMGSGHTIWQTGKLGPNIAVTMHPWDLHHAGVELIPAAALNRPV